ncbi:MAG: ABC transporter ATP-binding protein [Pseudomonadota bacterium]
MNSSARRLANGIAALYDPFRASGDREQDAPPQTLGAFFKWSFRGMTPAIYALAAAGAAIGFIEVASLAMLGQLVDIAATANPETVFDHHWDFFLLLAAVVLVLRPVATVGQAALTSLVINPGLAPRILWGLHRHMLGQSLRFYEDDFAGRLAQKQLQTAGAVHSVTTEIANAVGLLLAFVLGMAVALGAADWRLGLLTVLWGVGYGFALWGTLPGIREAARERAKRRSAVSGQFVDSFTNIRTVKLFAYAGREEEAARQSLERYREATLTFGRRVLALRLWLALLNAALMAGLIFGALALWQAGLAGIGLAAAAGALAFRLYGLSGWISFAALSIFSELGVAEDGVSSLTGDHDVVDDDGALRGAAAFPATLRDQHPDAVRFEDVTFAYGQPDSPTGAEKRTRGRGADGAEPPSPPAGVDNITLSIRRGERVGLVGPSGAGKSTLIALLLRLYDLNAGRVLVDGRDVREVSQDALRAHVGVITQETALFNRSALANIRYGRPEASVEEAVEAARRAQADAFIRDLEDGEGRRGYDAHLGERGVKLSGGQRQRIALARVLLKDAPILILDEATSALDSEVESAILDAVDAASEEKTVIAIAHRLSTIARMDRIVVMSDGQIVEQGDHASLLREDGVYARLWARQSDGFLGSAPTLPTAAE